jgi:probable phosphoglycerate mutase
MPAIIPNHPIYLLRHGQTEWNRDDKRQGQLDSSLTDKGFAQAEAMGRTVARLLQRPLSLTGEGWGEGANAASAAPSHPLDGPLPLPLRRGNNWRLVASPLGRAYQTAEIVGIATGLIVTVDERLMELAMGSWEGLTWPEILTLGPYKTDTRYPQFHIPDGERYASAAARAGRWLAGIDRPTIAVSHGLIGLVIRCVYLGLDETGLENFETPRQDVILKLENGKIEEIMCT